MRTRITISTLANKDKPYYRDISELPDALGTVLATQGLVELRETFADGRVITYGRIEYRCEWCGEYGHAIEACPRMAEDDGCPNDDP